jgi:hypothetical protein
MDALFANAPEIISKASQSPLGIFALMILVTGILAFVFFRAAPVAVRSSVFFLIFTGVVAFGVAIVRQLPAPGDTGPDARQPETATGETRRDVRPPQAAHANVDGQWKGHEAMSLQELRRFFQYVYLPPADLLFTLKRDGDAVRGKVTVLKNDSVYNSADLDYGILEGKLDGSKLSFQIKTEVRVNGTEVVRVDRFDGTVDGDRIHFWVQEDSGRPPLEFTASRVGP